MKRAKKTYSDTEILDWLHENCRHGFNACVNTNNRSMWEAFTVPSQHVYGKTLRSTLIKAMKKNVCGK